MNLKTRDLAFIALLTTTIGLLARFSIPLPFSPVPITGQTLGVFLAGSLLGAKRGALAVIAYLLLGAAGAPVFSFGQGGLHIIAGSSGGFLLGFIPGVYLLGKIIERFGTYHARFAAGGMLACQAIIYLCGSLYLAWLMQLAPREAVIIGVLPYLPGDLLKIAVSIPLGQKIRRALGDRLCEK